MANTDQKTRRDIYQEITDQIVVELEKGSCPWHRPWKASHLDGRALLPLRHNGIPYRGVNILALWMASVARGYGSPIWMTFRQALELGGAVRKGEKGSLTVYANTLIRHGTDETSGEDIQNAIRFMKGYTVFNVEQIDGLPSHYYAAPQPVLEPLARIERADGFFAATGATIRNGGNSAHYTLADDHIQMPPFDAFETPENYYATLAHETTHWTGHPSRLDRHFGQKRFGDDGYATEELVAELGSAFLCATLELDNLPRADHASYLSHWLGVLKADKRAIFSAAAHAQRAVDFLRGLQPDADPVALVA
jgi:antirestriction protein ArdC